MNWQELKEKMKENKKTVIATIVALVAIIIIIILLLVSCGDKKGKGDTPANQGGVGTEQTDNKNHKDDDEVKPGEDNLEGGLQVADPDDEQVIADSTTDISEYFEDVVETEKVEPKCKDGKHKVTHVKKVSATTTKEGNIEYWYCKDCKKYYADKECTELIKGGKKATVIPKKPVKEEPKDPEVEIEEVEKPDDCVSKEHEIQHVERVEATKESEGNIEYWYCKECDKYYRDAACTELIVNGKDATVIPKKPENLQEDTDTSAGWGRFY